MPHCYARPIEKSYYLSSICTWMTVFRICLKARYCLKIQLTGFRKPKYAPTNTRGREIPNHIPSRVANVRSGITEEDCSAHNIRFSAQKIAKMILSRKSYIKMHGMCNSLGFLYKRFYYEILSVPEGKC